MLIGTRRAFLSLLSKRAPETALWCKRLGQTDRPTAGGLQYGLVSC